MRLTTFKDQITSLKVTPFDGESEMVEAVGHFTIEPIGKYKNDAIARVRTETYKYGPNEELARSVVKITQFE